MDRNQYLLPGIIILVVLVVLVIAFAYSGNNTFKMGTVSFEYPNTWSQENVVGNFSTSALFSQVTLTANFADSNGVNQPAYIIIQMQQKANGTLNLPSSTSIVTNTSNSSVATTQVNNLTASQVGSFGTNIATKYTVIDKNNFYYVVTYISPVYAINQTQTAYTNLLSTLKLG
ncbi:MAG: hypothetical protein WAK14_07385 [Methanobacterium sp.]